MLRIEHGDILELDVDAIVVPQLRDTILFSELTTRIFNAAGYARIKREYLINRCFEEQIIFRNETAFRNSGKKAPSVSIPEPLVVVTFGHNLKAKNAIHVVVDTVKWMREKSGLNCMEKEMILHQCYNGVLDRAYNKLGAKSIAIPLLGESFLDLTVESSRMIAEDIINKWLQKKSLPLTRYGTLGDEALTKGRRSLESPMTIYLVLPASDTAIVPAASAVAPPAPVYEKRAVIPAPPKAPKTPELIEVDSECGEEIAKFEKRYENARKRKSGSKLEQYNNAKCLEYLERIPNAAEFASIVGIHPSNITHYKNYFWGSKNKTKPSPKMIVAMSIFIGLDGYERYEFFRSALGKYPYDYEIYNQTEMIISKGNKSFGQINKELCKIDRKFDLTKNKTETRKKTSAEKTK